MLLKTAIHLEGGSGNEHISKVKWVMDDKSNIATKETMIEWINEGNQAFVSDSSGIIEVLVVHAQPPYLRTYADGRWSNNLLSLPQF